MLIMPQACPQEVAAQIAGLAAGLHAQACSGIGGDMGFETKYFMVIQGGKNRFNCEHQEFDC